MDAELFFHIGEGGFSGRRNGSRCQSTFSLHSRPSHTDPLGRAGDISDPMEISERFPARKMDSPRGLSVGCRVICMLCVVFKHSHKLAKYPGQDPQ